MTFPPSQGSVIEPFEEETLPGYDPTAYYPIHIGDRLASRYHVIGKLGYGSNSIAWFCRDLETTEYVTVKVCTRSPKGKIHRERLIYEHLSTLTSTNPGRFNIREAIESFDLVHKGAVHACFVHVPLQCTLFAFQRLGGLPKELPEEMVKPIMRSLLEALDFLHTDANITHCDLKLSNLMLRIDDESILTDYENEEMRLPSRRKVINEERTIYASRHFRQPRGHAYGLPVLCDFGEARLGSSHAYMEIQPEVYKSPEILMQLRWGHQIDIWNAACVLWDMLKARHLFHGCDEEGLHNNRHHMCEIVSLIGDPPADFLRHSPHATRLFDANGKWKTKPPTVPSRFQGDSKDQYLDFLRSMLCWLPEKRMTARQLLQHSWLRDI